MVGLDVVKLEHENGDAILILFENKRYSSTLCTSIIILAEEVAASNIGLYTSRHVISSARD